MKIRKKLKLINKTITVNNKFIYFLHKMRRMCAVLLFGSRFSREISTASQCYFFPRINRATVTSISFINPQFKLTKSKYVPK